MKKIFLLLATATFAFASCTKSDVTPPAATPIDHSIGASAKAKPVTPPPTTTPTAPATGGSGKSGGGAAPAPAPTNTQIFTQWLTGTWASSIGVAEGAPTIVFQIIYNANGTFNASTFDNGTGARTAFSGNWKLTTPTTPQIVQGDDLTLTSGKTILLSGFAQFVHPGVMIYNTTTNNLAAPLKGARFPFQKL